MRTSASNFQQRDRDLMGITMMASGWRNFSKIIIWSSSAGLRLFDVWNKFTELV